MVGTGPRGLQPWGGGAARARLLRRLAGALGHAGPHLGVFALDAPAVDALAPRVDGHQRQNAEPVDQEQPRPAFRVLATGDIAGGQVVQHHVRVGQVLDELIQLRRQGRIHCSLGRQVRQGGGDIARFIGDFLDQQAQAQCGLGHAQDARHRHLPDAGRARGRGDVFRDFVQVDAIGAFALVLLVPALERPGFEVNRARLHVHDLDQQGRGMGMLEDMTVPAHRDRSFVIEIQWTENRFEGDGRRTVRGEISCIQLFLRFIHTLLTV